MAERLNSTKLFARAKDLMPGGVNSPVRAFRSVGGEPVYFERGEGAYLYDVDGHRYLDLVSSWGAIILGHAHPAVTSRIAATAARGTSFGAPHGGEIALAELVLERTGLERVRFTNSGTEASLGAVRLVRAATGRTKILKFSGNYHGAIDPLLAKAGSGIATFGLPDSEGVPVEATRDTLTARYNDLADVERLLSTEVAAIFVEPVAGNMGLIPPNPEFLAGLRRLADQFGTLLVFDEVMTGFRVSSGGAAARYGVSPDLAIMGKVIGGGLPVGAYGGRKELMDWIAPQGPVYQAGTLAGNPLSMAAGHAVLKLLDAEAYDHLEQLGAHLEAGLRTVPGVQVQRVGSMISVFFTDAPVTDFDAANETDKARYAEVFHRLLAEGVYLPPSALESWFLNTAMTMADMDIVTAAFAEACA